MTDKKVLEAYIDTLNNIEDYFEYTNESRRDRAFVQRQLTELTDKLKELSLSSISGVVLSKGD